MKRIGYRTKMILGSLLTALILTPNGWGTGFSFSASPSPQAGEGRDCIPEPTDMSIAYGDLVTCTIDPIGDTDIFRFSATAGEVVSIRVSLVGGLGRVLGELADPAERRIGSASSRIDARLERTGIYTIQVSGMGQPPLRYALSLERIAPPSPSATPLSSGQTATSDINPAGDVDLYFFRGAPGDQITITTSRVSGLGMPVAELFDPDGGRIGQPSGRIEVRLEKMGIYTIRVSATTEPHTFTYSIGLQCMGQCPPAEELQSRLTLPLVSVGRANEGIRQTAFILVNTSISPVTGTLDVVQPDGLTPLPVTIGNTTNSQFSLSIPPGGVEILETRDTAALVQGYANVTTNMPLRAGAIIRSAMGSLSGNLVFQTSYGTLTSATAFTVLADSIGGDTDSGLVILNLSASQPADLTLRLISQSGQQVAQTMLSVAPGELSREPGGEVIRFMSTDLFPSVSGINEFRGTVAVTSSVGVSVLAVQRKNNRLTILPVF